MTTSGPSFGGVGWGGSNPNPYPKPKKTRQVTASGSSFALNAASIGGGALALGGVQEAALSLCEFDKNAGGREGGAVQLYAASAVAMRSLTFRGNSARLGGAVFAKQGARGLSAL